MSVSPFELVASAVQRPLLIVGAPLDGSGTLRGEARAPAALRAAGLVERIDATDFGDLDVRVDDPDRDPETGIVGYRDLVSASRTVRDAVASTLAAGWRPVVLGGCCSILPGAFAGVRRRLGPTALAFVDGHLDLFDRETTRTGEAAGMALGLLVGRGPRELTGLAGERPLVEPGDVVAIGDGDGPRRVAFRAPGPSELVPETRVIDAGAVVREGAEHVGATASRLVGAGTAPFWLHLDVDVVDAEAMPAVSFPVATGLGWEDVAQVVRPLLRSPRLIGVSLTDYNPDLDPGGELAERLVDLLAEALRGAVAR